MWCDVTKSLKMNDIDNATNSKLKVYFYFYCLIYFECVKQVLQEFYCCLLRFTFKLEEKQRTDARVRKETDSKWITRVSNKRNMYISVSFVAAMRIASKIFEVNNNKSNIIIIKCKIY